jgi:hypothetical protein
MQRYAITVVLLGILMAGCSAGGSGSSSPSATDLPTQSSTADQPTPAATEPTAPAASDGPTPPAEAAIPLDTVVATTAEGLTVRRTPGTGGERIGFLSLGTVAYVLEGPTEVDGLPWYRITGLGLPYASGCITTPPDQPIECPAFHGWAAGASAAGDPWLAPADPGDCPEPTIESISESGFTWRLICWADDPITFEAWWPEIPDDAGLGGVCPQEGEPGGFLYCQHINYNGLSASPDEGFFVNRLALSIDPTSGVTIPERGQWIRVTGQFDHPSADACADLATDDEDPDGAVFACRLQFVPTGVEPLGG